MVPALKTVELRKIYKKRGKAAFPALESLSLEIEEGEIYGFIGPNGAGKTTTIKILTGLLPPTSGQASIFGSPAGSIEAKGFIGYLSETAAYYPFLEARALLSYFGLIHHLQSAHCAERIREVLSLVHLEGEADTRLSQFSKGMLQRFGIAQALLHSPKVLLLDEPTSGLDPVGQHELLGILKGLKGKGMTIFFSSHQLQEVEGLCDKVGIIHQGKILFSGGLESLRRLHEGEEEAQRVKIRFAPEGGQRDEELPYPSEKLPDGLYQALVRKRDLMAALDLLRSKGSSIHAVVPVTPTLEEIFMRMVVGS